MSKENNKCYIFLIIVTFAVIVIIFLLASVPPVSRDALTHHLFIPKLYIEEGGIYEIPEIQFSYYPMNLDLLYGIALFFGNDIVPKYIHFCFALFTAALIYSYIEKRISSLYGLVGVLFFLTIPIIVKLSITAYVDLGLVFFSTASLLLILKWAESNFSIYHLILAGVCCGFALGTKYNGLINLFLFTLFIPVIYLRSPNSVVKRNGTKAILFSGIFFIIAGIFFSPWLIRNYSWTGNPIYPLYNSFFQHQVTKFSDSKSEEIQSKTLKKDSEITSRSKNVFVNRKILYQEKWWEAIILPIRFFFQGEDGNPKYFDGKLTPFLLLLPIFAFFIDPTNKTLKFEKRVLLIYAVLFFSITFFQSVLRVRYIACIIPPLVILSIFGLRNIIDIMKKKCNFRRRVGVVAVSVSVPIAMYLYNFNYIFHQYKEVCPISYLWGEIDRDKYITQFYPEYPVIQYANREIQKESKVLCLYLGNRGYYMNFQPVFDRPTSDGLLNQILVESLNELQVKTELQKQNINHILLRNDLTKNWLTSLDKEQKEIVNVFFKNKTEILMNNGYYTFLKIKNS